MATTRDIKRRIKSVKNTQQITRAMKMVAAAKLRKAQERVTAARPYSEKVYEVLNRVASSSVGLQHPLLEVRKEGKTAIVVVSADRGLCGGFNGNIIRTVHDDVLALADKTLVTIGGKAASYFEHCNLDISMKYTGLGDDPSYEIAKEIAQKITELYTEGTCKEVYLYYTKFITVMQQQVTKLKILPFEVETAEEETVETEHRIQKEEKPIHGASYLYEPSAEEVLEELLPKYIETMVYRALVESKASEQGSRMTAMDSATNNADEMIAKLTLFYNRARQAAITQEISEIVSGASALE